MPAMPIHAYVSHTLTINQAQSKEPEPAGNQGIPSSIYRSLTKRNIQESSESKKWKNSLRTPAMHKVPPSKANPLSTKPPIPCLIHTRSKNFKQSNTSNSPSLNNFPSH